MKKCQKCGHLLKKNEEFCPKCGAKYMPPRIELVKPIYYRDVKKKFWQQIGASIVVAVVFLGAIYALCSTYNRNHLSFTSNDNHENIWLVTQDNTNENSLNDNTIFSYAYRFFYDDAGNLKVTIYSLGADAKLGRLSLYNGRLTYQSIAKYVNIKEGTYKVKENTYTQANSQKNNISFTFRNTGGGFSDPSEYQYDTRITLTRSLIKQRLSTGNYAVGYRTRQGDIDNVDKYYKGYLVTVTRRAHTKAVFQNMDQGF